MRNRTAVEVVIARPRTQMRKNLRVSVSLDIYIGIGIVENGRIWILVDWVGIKMAGGVSKRNFLPLDGGP
jgi:hypothetical protein